MFKKSGIDEYGRTLSGHEGHLNRNGDNGHTLRKHVYLYNRNDLHPARKLTMDDLRSRCRNDFNQAFGGGTLIDTYVSKFNSYKEAKYTARKMIEDNREGINAFQLMNASGASSNTVYSIGKGKVIQSTWLSYWASSNAVNCNVSVLGKKTTYGWWSWYDDAERLKNARMEIRFNKSRSKIRWYIDTVYPTI